MTCWVYFYARYYDVNYFVFYAILKNFWSLFTIYVKLSNEDISLIRHLDRNEWNEWSGEISYFCFSKSKCIVDTFDKYSNIICIWIILCFLKIFKKHNIIQIQIILEYLSNVSTIHLLLLKQKYEISPLHSFHSFRSRWRIREISSFDSLT